MSEEKLFLVNDNPLEEDASPDSGFNFLFFSLPNKSIPSERCVNDCEVVDSYFNGYGNRDRLPRMTQSDNVAIFVSKVASRR